jgi:uncharacterized DUF497 family protein
VDFVWDPKKARANLLEHRVSFTEAATVFADPYAVYEPEHRHHDRGVVIGASVESRLLFVVHIEVLEDELIRIISARRATRAEKRRYASGQAGD